VIVRQWNSESGDGIQRLHELFEKTYPRFKEFEPQMRAALQLSLTHDALDRAGVLMYETFAVGNERFGKPSNPDFLLQPGELLAVVCGRLKVIAFEDLYVEEPKPAMVQRICAVGLGHRGAAS